jgi:hypothetical protein
MRSAIGVDTERGASEITDGELAELYNNGGLNECDPHVAIAMSQHLMDMGFFLTSSSDRDNNTDVEQHPVLTDSQIQLGKMSIANV